MSYLKLSRGTVQILKIKVAFSFSKNKEIPASKPNRLNGQAQSMMTGRMKSVGQ